MSEDVTGRVPQPVVDPDHVHHDALLVARFAAGDTDGDDLDAARALVERCSQCAALAQDLALVASSLHELPRAARPRDFQLTQTQADQLRGGFVQRLLRTLAAPRWTVVRPLAGAAMTLGIVLAVFGATLSAYAPGLAAPAFDQGGSQPAVINQEGTATSPVAAAATAAAAPRGSQPLSGETIAPAAGSSVPQPPSPASQTENYTDVAPGPPSAGSSSGGQSGPGLVTPAPPATQAPQPAASTTERVAQGTGQTSVNPIPPSGAGGSPSQSELVRAGLILGGLAVAVASLALLLLVSYARRKFRVETGKPPLT